MAVYRIVKIPSIILGQILVVREIIRGRFVFFVNSSGDVKDIQLGIEAARWKRKMFFSVWLRDRVGAVCALEGEWKSV